MATEVWNPAQDSLAMMDIAVERNAYGRQIDSRVILRLRREQHAPRFRGQGSGRLKI
jgi:glutamine amidotransferase PdxT